MNQYVTTFAESTAQSISVRISISYFSLTRMQSPTVCESAFLRLGRSVVSISNLPKEDAPTIVRNILIAFLIFRKFNDLRVFGRSARIAAISLPRFTKMWQKRMSRLTIQQLTDEVLQSAVDLNKSLPGWHWRIIYTPSVTDLVRQIATSVYSSILLIRHAAQSSVKL